MFWGYVELFSCSLPGSSGSLFRLRVGPIRKELTCCACLACLCHSASEARSLAGAFKDLNLLVLRG